MAELFRHSAATPLGKPSSPDPRGVQEREQLLPADSKAGHWENPCGR